MMNEFCKKMTERHSIRRFRAEQVPDGLLEDILLAASHAPNAGNRQTTRLAICQDAALNEQLGRINKAAFHGRISDGTRFISQDQPSIADDPSIVSAYYGAPTVVTLFGPRNFLYTEADCWIFASYMALAASSCGVGSCLLGRAEDTFASPLGRETQRAWGIPEDFEAKVHVALGFPSGDAPAPKARTYSDPIVVR